MKSLLSVCRVSILNNLIRRYASNEKSSSIDFETAKSRLESSSVEVDNETKLKLYGLYKQSTAGVCSIPKPGLTDFVGRAKWTAWSSLGKMNQEDAQKQYIQTVQQLISSSTSNSKLKYLSFIENETICFLLKVLNQHLKVVRQQVEKVNQIVKVFN
jgi:acyl-CoA-binding protein